MELFTVRSVMASLWTVGKCVKGKACNKLCHEVEEADGRGVLATSPHIRLHCLLPPPHGRHRKHLPLNCDGGSGQASSSGAKHERWHPAPPCARLPKETESHASLRATAVIAVGHTVNYP